MPKPVTPVPLITCPPNWNMRLVSWTGGDYDPLKAKAENGVLPQLDPTCLAISFIRRPGATSEFTTEWFENPAWYGTLTVREVSTEKGYFVVTIALDDGLPPVVGLMSCASLLEALPRFTGGKAFGRWSAVAKAKRNSIIPA
jgi:hypothetical protein